MILYPTMELQQGRCVSLEGGRLEAAAIWHVDPVATARGWAASGAEWMHVTDLDAVSGKGDNRALIETLIRAAGIPVQVAGGCRSEASVMRWIDAGAGRVVVSTLAARDPESVKALANRLPDQLVLSLDVKNGQVMTDGWRSPAAYSAEALISAFNDTPLAGIVVTDIDSDIADRDAQLGLISGLAAKARPQVIASGIVRSVDDVARLKYVPNISGALVGRALFRKSLDLKDALAVARPEPEKVADFL